MEEGEEEEEEEHTSRYSPNETCDPEWFTEEHTVLYNPYEARRDAFWRTEEHPFAPCSPPPCGKAADGGARQPVISLQSRYLPPPPLPLPSPKLHLPGRWMGGGQGCRAETKGARPHSHTHSLSSPLLSQPQQHLLPPCKSHKYILFYTHWCGP